MDEEGYIVLFYFLLSFNGQEIAVQALGCIINQLPSIVAARQPLTTSY
jgi:hypothetical protein